MALSGEEAATIIAEATRADSPAGWGW